MRQIIHFDNMGSIGSYESSYSSGLSNIPQYAWTKSRNLRFLGRIIEPMRVDKQVASSASFSGTSGVNFKNVNLIDTPLASSSVGFYTRGVFLGTFGVYAADISGTAGFKEPVMIQSQVATVGGQLIHDVISFGHNIAIYVGNDGTPRQWGDSTSYASVTKMMKPLENWSHTAGVRCRFMKPFKNYLIAGGIIKGSTNYPNKLKWSHPSDFNNVPSSWDYANPAIDAGEIELGPAGDDIVTSEPLGDINIVYKYRSVWGMEFIGAPNVFKFFEIFNDIGLIDNKCVVSIENIGHAVMGHNDIYFHDGKTKRSIFPKDFINRIILDMETAYTNGYIVMYQAVHFAPMNEVWFCYRYYTGGFLFAAVWNYKHNTHYMKYFDNYYSAFSGTSLLFKPTNFDLGRKDSLRYLMTAVSQFSGITDGIYKVEGSNTYQAGYVLKAGLPLGRQNATGEIKQDQTSIKEVFAIYPHLEMSVSSTVTMSVSLILSNKLFDSGKTTSYSFVSTAEKVDVRGSGRFVGVKFGWPKSTKKIGLTGFSIDVNIEGDR